MGPPKVSNTCDECKSRKVRCVKVPNSDMPLCRSCNNRGLACRFSFKKRRVKQAPPRLQGNADGCVAFSPASQIIPDGSQPLTYSGSVVAATGVDTTMHAHQQQPNTSSSNLYVDFLLEGRSTAGGNRDESSMLKAHAQKNESFGITFFSERRLASISDRLGHRRFCDILETFYHAINKRMNRRSQPSAARIEFKAPAIPLQVSDESCKRYITAYFDHIHPTYPFLDRAEYEEKALHREVARFLQESPSFSALHHTVLALGCQYHGGGSFEPGVGTAWQLFQIALGLFSEIIIPKEALVNVQAVTAMDIFARNSSCVQIGNMLTAEAARMAQSIGLNKAICENENMATCQRTFWVIYILEKTLSFTCNKDSILIDSAIATPVPKIAEAIFRNFDWFNAMCRFSRLVSKAYVAVFSISATLNCTLSMQTVIDTFWLELEAWKTSIPKGFRPDNTCQPLNDLKAFNATSLAIALRVHYHYYSVAIALARVDLNLRSSGRSPRLAIESELMLLSSSSKIIELTKYIDTETYTPIWVLLSVPVSALFIVFDFIIHHPTHPEAKRNLPLLGIAVGYFCRLDYVSGGVLQLSFLSDIFQIARSYIHNVECGLLAEDNEANDPVPTQNTPAQSTDIVQDPSTLRETTPGREVYRWHNTFESYETPDNISLFACNECPETIDLMDLFGTTLPASFGPF